MTNKTVAAWRDWVSRPDATVLVAESSGQITGIGMIDHRGVVLLNYVNPDARFTGTSKTILAALETVAAKHEVEKCIADSTQTAKAFYISAGYCPASPNSLRMKKRLA